MAIDYTLPITTVTDGKLAPVTTGTYYLRVSPFSSNTYTGTHVANGVWSFGTVNDGIYQLWDASAQVTAFGEKWIGDDAPTFSTVTASTAVSTDTVSEKTSAAGVTIDGVKLKDSEVYTDVIKEKTGAAGVTIDGVLLKDNGITCTGGASFSSTAPQSSVAPSNANDLVNKTYADALVPFKYWYGRFTGDASSPTLTKLAGNLGGEITVTRTTDGTYSLNCSALFTSAKTHITDGIITDGNTETVETLYDNVSTSLITLYCYDNANALNDKAIVDIEIKVFS